MFIDLYITIMPILILDVTLWGLNDFWYFSCIIMCIFSCVDPFLCLNFIKHKLSDTRKNVYQFKFLLSFFIIMLALLLPTQPRKPSMTLEQSNDHLFIMFALLCFVKFMTVIDELLLKNKILINVFVISKHVLPMLKNIFGVILLMQIMFTLIGNVLYGGLINS